MKGVKVKTLKEVKRRYQEHQNIIFMMKGDRNDDKRRYVTHVTKYCHDTNYTGSDSEVKGMSTFDMVYNYHQWLTWE